ncbi:MAG: ABC transporter substrate-binding protein [Alphaproteobacteria bacterium]|nr:ABC transporter substrate-binding protein [Alphaproteobacteria bacterium]
MQRYFPLFFKVCVLWVALWGLSLIVLPKPSQQKTADIRIAVQTAPRTLHPFKATDAAAVRLLQHVTPALGKFDQAFNIQPDIASAITPTHYGFNVSLPQNATWHDGTKLNAQDIIEIYKGLQSGTYPYSSLTQGLKKIESLKSGTLQFYTHTQDPYNAKILTVPLVKMKDSAPVGLGPWELSQTSNLHSLVLTHRTSKKTALLQTIKSPDVRLMALQKGEIDILHGDISPELFAYGKKKEFKGAEAPSESYSYIGFNTKNTPTNNIKVRKAIAYAIDRQLLISALLKEGADPALSVLMPSHQSVFNIHPPQYNLSRAKAIMHDLGYSHENPLNITLSITNNAFIHKLAQVIQGQLKGAHIALNIQSTEWGTFYENVKKGATEMYILTWVGAFDTDFLNQVYHSEMTPPKGLNRGFYRNKTIDYLLDTLKKTPKGQRHNNIAKEIQRITAKDLIYVPLWRASHKALTSKRVDAYNIPPDGGYPLNGLVE